MGCTSGDVEALPLDRTSFNLDTTRESEMEVVSGFIAEAVACGLGTPALEPLCGLFDGAPPVFISVAVTYEATKFAAVSNVVATGQTWLTLFQRSSSLAGAALADGATHLRTCEGRAVARGREGQPYELRHALECGMSFLMVAPIPMSATHVGGPRPTQGTQVGGPSPTPGTQVGGPRPTSGTQAGGPSPTHGTYKDAPQAVLTAGWRSPGPGDVEQCKKLLEALAAALAPRMVTAGQALLADVALFLGPPPVASPPPPLEAPLAPAGCSGEGPEGPPRGGDGDDTCGAARSPVPPPMPAARGADASEPGPGRRAAPARGAPFADDEEDLKKPVKGRGGAGGPAAALREVTIPLERHAYALTFKSPATERGYVHFLATHAHRMDLLMCMMLLANMCHIQLGGRPHAAPTAAYRLARSTQPLLVLLLLFTLFVNSFKRPWYLKRRAFLLGALQVLQALLMLVWEPDSASVGQGVWRSTALPASMVLLPVMHAINTMAFRLPFTETFAIRTLVLLVTLLSISSGLSPLLCGTLSGVSYLGVGYVLPLWGVWVLDNTKRDTFATLLSRRRV